jgi:hypothetical protein
MFLHVRPLFLEIYYLGTFDKKEDAYRAYCKKADELFGEFANYG